MRYRCPAAVQPEQQRGPDPRCDGRQSQVCGGGVRAQVLHHVRRIWVDEHAAGDQNRLDHQDVRPHRVGRVCAPERQAGGVHLGLRFQRRQPSLGRRHLPGRRQLVQGPGLLRDRRGAAGVAHRHRRLTRRLPEGVPRLQYALPVDGRRDRYRRRLRLGVSEHQHPRPGRLQRQRRRLPALRATWGRLGPPAGARGLHVAPVLQHGPGRRPRHLHLDVRRIRRRQPHRQDRGNAGRCPGRLWAAGSGRRRHGLFLRLLSAPDQRRRTHAQRPDRPPAPPAPPSPPRAAPPPPPWSACGPAPTTCTSPPTTRALPR